MSVPAEAGSTSASGVDERNPIVVEHRSRGEMFLNRAITIVVDSPVAAENANNGIVKGKEYLEAVHRQRRFFTKPLEEQVDRINALFTELAKPFETGLVNLNGKVKEYLVAQQKEVENRKREEMEKVRKEQEAHPEKSSAEFTQQQLDLEKKFEAEKKAAGTVTSQAGATQVRYRWTYEVTDYSQVDEAYKTLNEAAVKLAISQGIREIAGIRIFQEPYVAGKGGKKKAAAD